MVFQKQFTLFLIPRKPITHQLITCRSIWPAQSSCYFQGGRKPCYSVVAEPTKGLMASFTSHILLQAVACIFRCNGLLLFLLWEKPGTSVARGRLYH